MLSVRFKNTAERIERLKPVVESIRAVPVTEPLGRARLMRLICAWGNFGYSASLHYLMQVERTFLCSTGAVLECGSGATTLLLALLAEKEGRSVVTLENHEAWGAHMKSVLAGLDCTQSTVCYSALKNYGEYEWYDAPSKSLPKSFGLVVCDGPPGGIRGGRYGLMPIMNTRLSRGCHIVLDDTDRRRERELVVRWAAENNLKWEAKGLRGRCTVLTRKTIQPITEHS